MAAAYADAARAAAASARPTLRREPVPGRSAATTASWRSRGPAPRPRWCARSKRPVRRSPRSPHVPTRPVGRPRPTTRSSSTSPTSSPSCRRVFATTALMLLRGSLGETLDPVIAQARGRARRRRPRSAPASSDAEQFTFLGQGWAYGIALEAGAEDARGRPGCGPRRTRRWSTGTARSRSPQPGRAVWVFGEPVDGIVDDIAATGATLVDDDLDPVADLVRAQLLAVRRAEAAAPRPRPAATASPARSCWPTTLPAS